MSDEIRAFKMQLKPGVEGVVAEYKKRHDELWPELAEALRGAGIFDYSIFLDEGTLSLFAVLKLKPGHPIDELPLQPVMRRWWDYMAPLMEVEPDNKPRQWDLPSVFHFAG
jgi:L-rhamnose mutarotase